MLRQTIALISFSIVFVLGLVDSTFAANPDFVSNWVNTNPNKHKTTRLAISLTKSKTLSIKVFELGNCVPNFDCNMGTTKLVKYNVPRSKHQFARAEYRKGSSRIVMILRLAGVGSKNMSRRILLQRFTLDKNNRQINSSQDVFMPTAQIWPLPSPCFSQDPRSCSKKPGWTSPPRK